MSIKVVLTVIRLLAEKHFVESAMTPIGLQLFGLQVYLPLSMSTTCTSAKWFSPKRRSATLMRCLKSTPFRWNSKKSSLCSNVVSTLVKAPKYSTGGSHLAPLGGLRNGPVRAEPDPLLLQSLPWNFIASSLTLRLRIGQLVSLSLLRFFLALSDVCECGWGWFVEHWSRTRKCVQLMSVVLLKSDLKVQQTGLISLPKWSAWTLGLMGWAHKTFSA
jgi:hypothetical protein